MRSHGFPPKAVDAEWSVTEVVVATLYPNLRRLCSVEISPSNQVFYFLPELYAIFRSMPVVHMELTIPGVISFGRVCPHLGGHLRNFSCCTWRKTCDIVDVRGVNS